ncbi:MAG: hypothetical protein ACJ8R9_20425 [Steroidobacteraceae bacterium]
MNNNVDLHILTRRIESVLKREQSVKPEEQPTVDVAAASDLRLRAVVVEIGCC